MNLPAGRASPKALSPARRQVKKIITNAHYYFFVVDFFYK